MSLDSFESVPESQEEIKLGAFQNPNYLTVDVPGYWPRETFQNEILIHPEESLPSLDAVPTGEYVGPSLESLEYEIEQATKDLEDAEERLQEAIDSGASVLTAMSIVDSCRSILDTRIRMYNDALNAMSVGAKETSDPSEAKLGSVSHKQWELEQAIKSGNPIAIEHKQRDLAHEIAKEEAKKLQKK